MIYLGLGSNDGDRRQHLTEAIDQLQRNGFEISCISPVLESPALLKADSKPEWNQPYLNLVVGGTSHHSPLEVLVLAKSIEKRLGRDLNAPQWSPRPIDIDILLWHDEKIKFPELTIPHPELYKRAFVITPLTHLAPHLVIPGIELTPMQISQQIRPIPLWMGIVNLTPDSFSDGGKNLDLDALVLKLEKWIEAGVHILDFGAQSTRPNADPVSEVQEWSRLAPILEVLERLKDKYALMPRVSLDTFHASVAQKALNKGFDWINDVTGLKDAAMLALIHQYNATGIAMHSLSVPVKRGEVLEPNSPVEQQLEQWLKQRRQLWEENYLDLGKIIFDPGIGFGKSATQNLSIIKVASKLRSHGFRVLMGHSRKSFMNSFADAQFADRDMETLGLSLALCEQGVDILRVHEPLSHIRAYRAWSHAQGNH